MGDASAWQRSNLKHDITSEHIPAAVAWRSSNSLNEVIKSSSSQRRDAAAVLAVLLGCVRVLQPQEEEACPLFSAGDTLTCVRVQRA